MENGGGESDENTGILHFPVDKGGQRFSAHQIKASTTHKSRGQKSVAYAYGAIQY